VSQKAVLEHCRKHGIWIIADDVYERLVYSDSAAQGAVAPSFLDISEPDDRIISTNTFSKSWLMTGWRLGWMVSPRGRDGSTLMADFGKLIEYNTSCAPPFIQLAAVAALEGGAPVIAATIERYSLARQALCALLEKIDGVKVMRPDGAMYVFFKIEAARDSLDFCKRLVQEAGLGLAPGAAFGPEGEGYVRWCLASGVPRLEEGVARLAGFLAKLKA
jgi:aspartate/methionine/tyrosine aminotransferase